MKKTNPLLYTKLSALRTILRPVRAAHATPPTRSPVFACLVSAGLGLGVALMSGCPIYESDDRYNRVCDSSQCYICPAPYLTSQCDSYTCSADAECPTGFECSTRSRCAPSGTSPTSQPTACKQRSDCGTSPDAVCGSDNTCHSGDCSRWGCSSDFVCKVGSGAATCEPTLPLGRVSECKADRDCSSQAGAPAGSKCLTGTCVAPGDQCADATQCAAGSQCVQGSCTPSCAATRACPTGYGCDVATGVCTGSKGTCSASSPCSSDSVCVEEHCVERCRAGSSCLAGLTCVDGGCTPEERPVFTCGIDGVQDKCQAGSVCLRHSCYIACEASSPEACKSADAFNVCKSVMTTSGAHAVCGSATNLGSDCDPTQLKVCKAAQVCIDGFCR